MVRSRLNVCPKINSQSAGWMARVTSSVRSWRSFWASSRHSVATRLGSTSQPVDGKRREVTDGGGAGSAEPACGTSGTTDIGQPFAGVGEVTAGVVAEHIVKSRLRTERADQLGGGADGPDATGVDERDLVAVVLGLVHVVRGHQHGHALGVAQADELQYLLDHLAASTARHVEQPREQGHVLPSG